MAADEDRDRKSFKERRLEFEERGDALRRIREKIQRLQSELQALNQRAPKGQVK
jgi:hypothetical protein